MHFTGFDAKWLKCDVRAKDKVTEMDKTALNVNPDAWYMANDNVLRVSFLNISSLHRHYQDLITDFTLMKSDIICLAETWLKTDERTSDFNIPGYNSVHASVGRGKGASAYFKYGTGSVIVSQGHLSIVKVGLLDLDVFTVYASKDCRKDYLFGILKIKMHKMKPNLIVGDFNFEGSENDTFVQEMKKEGFNQLVASPTHEKGGLIDHIYCNVQDLEHSVHSVLYSDHDALLIQVKDC